MKRKLQNSLKKSSDNHTVRDLTSVTSHTETGMIIFRMHYPLTCSELSNLCFKTHFNHKNKVLPASFHETKEKEKSIDVFQTKNLSAILRGDKNKFLNSNGEVKL